MASRDIRTIVQDTTEIARPNQTIFDSLHLASICCVSLVPIVYYETRTSGGLDHPAAQVVPRDLGFHLRLFGVKACVSYVTLSISRPSSSCGLCQTLWFTSRPLCLAWPPIPASNRYAVAHGYASRCLHDLIPRQGTGLSEAKRPERVQTVQW